MSLNFQEKYWHIKVFDIANYQSTVVNYFKKLKQTLGKNVIDKNKNKCQEKLKSLLSQILSKPLQYFFSVDNHIRQKNQESQEAIGTGEESTSASALDMPSSQKESREPSPNSSMLDETNGINFFLNQPLFC